MTPAAIPPGYGSFGASMEYAPAQDGNGDPTRAASSARSTVIDGTPARVAALGVAAVAVLFGLRWGGFRFNVAVGN